MIILKSIIALIILIVNRIKDIVQVNKNVMGNSLHMRGLLDSWDSLQSEMAEGLHFWVFIFLGNNHLKFYIRCRTYLTVCQVTLECWRSHHSGSSLLLNPAFFWYYIFMSAESAALGSVFSLFECLQIVNLWFTARTGMGRMFSLKKLIFITGVHIRTCLDNTNRTLNINMKKWRSSPWRKFLTL